MGHRGTEKLLQGMLALAETWPLLHQSFSIAAGVKQGCPLSPLLFAILMDPFFCAMQSLS